MNNQPAKKLDELKDNLQHMAIYPLPEEAKKMLNDTIQQTEELEKLLKAEYGALQDAISMAQQAKNKFVSVVTHELRLPLTSIKGYTDLLRQGIAGPINDQQLNFLDVVRSNVERMTSLISDLSDISHLETGRMKLAIQDIPVRQAIEGAINHFQTPIADKGQILEVEFPDDIPNVQADPSRLLQVLTCLVGNAYKYTPSGGRITLRAIPESEYTRFEVADTGIGISLEDQTKIFTQFFRSEDEAVREHPGWGLALYLSKRLVETMGGRMDFESKLGEGSKFWFMLLTQKDAG